MIIEYDSLTEEYRKRYKKEYIRSLFGYVVVNIENILRYYDAYSDNRVFNKEVSEYFFQQDKTERIVKCEKYLQKITEIESYSNKNNIDLQNDKPNYLDVYYRLAQIEQIKGLFYVLSNKPYEKYSSYFTTSNTYVDKVLELAKERRGKEHFLFPYHVKLTKAINLHFLNQIVQCHECFYNAKPWMIYEEGVLYFLQNNTEAALKVLKTIPQRDTCFTKAQKLINKITDEN